jgi:hypothetical protein
MDEKGGVVDTCSMLMLARDSVADAIVEMVMLAATGEEGSAVDACSNTRAC